jgi:hypothetical protein
MRLILQTQRRDGFRLIAWNQWRFHHEIQRLLRCAGRIARR